MSARALLVLLLIPAGSLACSLPAPYVQVEGPGVSCKLPARDLAATPFTDLLSMCSPGLSAPEAASLGARFNPRPGAHTRIEHQSATAYAAWRDRAEALARNQCSCSLVEGIERSGEWTKFEHGHKSCRFTTACWTPPSYCLVSFGMNPEPVFLSLGATIAGVAGFGAWRRRARAGGRPPAGAGGERAGAPAFAVRLGAHLANLLAWLVCLGVVLIYLRANAIAIDALTAAAVAAVSAPFAVAAWKLSGSRHGRTTLPVAIALLAAGIGALMS